MGLLDDVGAAWVRWNAWIERAVEAARDWVASEAGQNTLLGLDYLSLSVRIGDYYEHIGWYLPVHPAIHRYALDRLETRTPFDARDAVRLVGPGSEHWAWIVEGTLASPSLSDRRQVVEDAIVCLEHERWHAAVSTLLPVIEGLISDRSGMLEGKRVGRRLEELLDTEVGRWEVLSAVPAVSVLDAEVFERVEFSGVAIADEALNRHLVLHGRTARFGTPINAVRTFMLLIAIVELLDGVVLLRARSALSPTDSGSYLDQCGPLAELRAAGARRAAAIADSTDAY